MKTNKQMMKKILIILIIIILLLGIFYLYNYITNKNIKEGFTIPQAYYKGEPSYYNSNSNRGIPLPTGEYTPSTNNTYIISNLQKITSNNVRLYAIDTNTTIYSYSNTTKSWKSYQIDLSKPKITNPQYDSSVQNNILCKSFEGLLLSSSLTALWLYNSGANNTNKTDCIYYIPLNSDSSIPSNTDIFCLQLPLLTYRIIPTSTQSSTPTSTLIPTTTYHLPLQPFDTIRLLATNQSVLFALGCYNAAVSNGITPSLNDTGIYYCLLNNGIPINTDRTTWQAIGLPSNIIRSNINQMIVNDKNLFIHTSIVNQNGGITYSIYYMPITIQDNQITLVNWSKMGYNSVLNKPNGVRFNKLVINNDVIWGIEELVDSRQTNIWWCALKNGSEAPQNDNTYGWKNIVLEHTISPKDIVLYNNNLLVFSGSNSDNYVIALIGPFTPSISNSPTTTSNGSTPTGTGSPTTTSSDSGSGGGSGSGGSSGGSGSGGSGGSTGGSGSGSSSGSGSGTGASGSGTGGSGSGTGGSGSGTGGSGSGTGGSGPTTTRSGGGGTGGGGGGGTGSGGSGGVSGLSGTLDVNSNQNNLNDFMAKNTLIGSNIYLSPMNGPSTYTPSQRKSSNRNRNIQSSFNPSVDLA